MARKDYTPEQSIGMLREAEVRLSQGEKIGKICRGLGDEPRVGGKLELLDPVRLKAVLAPDAVNGTGADVDGLRHHGRGRPQNL